ncbi:MAG: nuclease-related domain-containing protein [Candidatus Parcubacteria bacterium]|nr:nuclease-related domain-containing protein [Candidatus Parcubacteria bacterium]
MEKIKKRLPGQSLDEKLQDFVDEKLIFYLFYITVIVIVIIGEWVRFFWKFEPHPVVISIVGLIVVIYLVNQIFNNLKDVKKLKKGRDGEREVGQYLEEMRSTGALIFHDILGPNFNIDHVIVSPHGIFTVETKTWSKRAKNESIKFDGKHLIVNGYSPDRDPLAQSLAQSQWLKNLLKESTGKEFIVNPVIVFNGWFVESETTRQVKEYGVLVLNPKALPSFVNNNFTNMSNEDLHLIAYHLARHIQSPI